MRQSNEQIDPCGSERNKLKKLEKVIKNSSKYR